MVHPQHWCPLLVKRVKRCLPPWYLHFSTATPFPLRRSVEARLASQTVGVSTRSRFFIGCGHYFLSSFANTGHWVTFSSQQTPPLIVNGVTAMIVNKSRFLFLHFLLNSFTQPVDDRGSVRTSRLLRNSDSAVRSPTQRQAVVDADGRGYLAKYLRRLVKILRSTLSNVVLDIFFNPWTSCAQNYCSFF
ncbi:hypothetical protein TNCT_309751 [Trichonephila clavata]|uniref:Uncharacterized protein n=1 Tax=Trichonephila clavata TaxID=2740835 RepID=A0A8X6FPN6_TRICU|nr:hypothetical protein TNCT_309751 [Trichonephila clavata]